MAKSEGSCVLAKCSCRFVPVTRKKPVDRHFPLLWLRRQSVARPQVDGSTPVSYSQHFKASFGEKPKPQIAPVETVDQNLKKPVATCSVASAVGA